MDIDRATGETLERTGVSIDDAKSGVVTHSAVESLERDVALVSAAVDAECSATSRADTHRQHAMAISKLLISIADAKTGSCGGKPSIARPENR